MRTYGRLLKNIAAIALLLALLSMLLPFCEFSAGGQEMTLSGLDVVKAGGRDRKSTRLNSSHTRPSRMPSSA